MVFIRHLIEQTEYHWGKNIRVLTHAKFSKQQSLQVKRHANIKSGKNRLSAEDKNFKVSVISNPSEIS